MNAYKLVTQDCTSAVLLVPHGSGFLEERVFVSDSAYSSYTINPTFIKINFEDYESISVCEFQSLKYKAIQKIKEFSALLPSPVFSI
ncbi:hypothetical protein [Runella slithyformis]|uniref:Uncharacterized protein n=1 Tax=Runella slithyformis (strain ATCC 29530 / DSM 19594 / LMG 11500 / NCIMB 11436 / LSU 4) TaxID=761193 RepID=A0A7U3ZN66_RUNSL|nr:hypothetical protein [Runella slithyformis]AEI50252.1 hypothetical protein Runsl_3896 [Runella slithyformis DSM 19594]